VALPLPMGEGCRKGIMTSLLKFKEEYTDCCMYPTGRHEDVFSIHLLLLYKTGPS
jgi:hypothetical protein